MTDAETILLDALGGLLRETKRPVTTDEVARAVWATWRGPRALAREYARALATGSGSLITPETEAVADTEERSF